MGIAVESPEQVSLTKTGAKLYFHLFFLLQVSALSLILPPVLYC